jgi:hypothetical protein
VNGIVQRATGARQDRRGNQIIAAGLDDDPAGSSRAINEGTQVAPLPVCMLDSREEIVERTPFG